jgi:putative membrane protein
MKKATLVKLVLFAGCLLQACGSGVKNDATADTDSVIDTTKKLTNIVDKDDIKFITDINSACLAEIKVGNLAKQKGHDKRIKNFGAMMIKDLTKGKTKLTALAKTKKIALPDSISTADQAAINTLAKKSGKDFDTLYLDKTAADHKKALELFHDEADHGYDPGIKAFASKNMLTLKRHLDAIDAMQSIIK